MISVLGGCRVTILSQNWQSFVLGFHRCLKIKILSQLDFHRVIFWSIGWRKPNGLKIYFFIHSKYSCYSEWLRCFCSICVTSYRWINIIGKMSTIMVRFLIPITNYWTEIGTSDATHGGEAAQLERAERYGGVGWGGGGGLRCGNAPVQNNVNRFLFQKAKYI